MPLVLRARSALLVLGLAAVLAAAEADAEDALEGRLRLVETALRTGDAAALRPFFAAQGKVRVELKDLTDGPGWCAPGQLQVLFARVFGEFTTREIRFPREDVTVPTPGTAFARGRWTRQARRGGPEVTQTLILTLQEEQGDWRILEVLTSR